MVFLKFVQFLLFLMNVWPLHADSNRQLKLSSWLGPDTVLSHQAQHARKTKINGTEVKNLAPGWDPFSTENESPVRGIPPRKQQPLDAALFRSKTLNATGPIYQNSETGLQKKTDNTRIKIGENTTEFAWNPFPNQSTSQKTIEKLRPGWNPWPTEPRGRQNFSSSYATKQSKNLAMNETQSPNKNYYEATEAPPKKNKKIINFGFQILKSQVQPLLKTASVRNQWIYILFGTAISSFQFLPSLLAPNIDAQAVGVFMLPQLGRLLISPQVLSPRLRHQLLGVRLEPSLLRLEMIPQVLSPEINTQLASIDFQVPMAMDLTMQPRVLSPEIDLQLFRTRPEVRAHSLFIAPAALSPVIRLALLRTSPIAPPLNAKIYVGGWLSPIIFGSLNDGGVTTLFEDRVGELFEALGFA